ncbi:Ig-like V-type domain-containing protein FAM187A [Haliotis rubra]|uniref:Ig-like V-type domain-containing protein FAM187A n=1 Tax=Haliotis rubra TaxID=36100 RepID=UPI001EE5B127|nr:Ig-like V-type domain-containing protein FAM187A [Haliotis rubra]
MRQGANNLPIQLVSMVEEGETTQFTCHYCGDETTKFVSMVWYRLTRQRTSGKYVLKEVELGMHDHESQNRVYVGADHTLHIKQAKKSDIGTYFCRDYTRKDEKIQTKMAENSIYSLLSDNGTFRFMYHFDVLLTSQMMVREISWSSRNPAMVPAEPKPYPNHNLVMTTSWEEWGVCNLCGRVGKRKRLGVCYIKKINQQRKCKPWYIDAIMTSYPAGVPCRSSLFRGHQEIKPRPDEIEAEFCEVPCMKGLVGLNNTKKGAISPDGIKTTLSFGKENAKLKRSRTVTMDEGSSVNLTCQGAPLDMPVVWLNNSRVIDVNNSDDRVLFHADNVLQISAIAPHDTATYHCLADGKVKAKIKLTVVPRLHLDTDAWIYAAVTSLTYPADLVLFLLLMVVKHRHRQTGLRLTRKQRREVESASSRGSSRGSSRVYESVTTEDPSSSEVHTTSSSESSTSSTEPLKYNSFSSRADGSSISSSTSSYSS